MSAYTVGLEEITIFENLIFRGKVPSNISLGRGHKPRFKKNQAKELMRFLRDYLKLLPQPGETFEYTCHNHRELVSFEKVCVLYDFLRGQKCYHHHCLNLLKEFDTKEAFNLSNDKAFSVIYILQEEVGAIPDYYEQCCHCGDLYDSYCDGTWRDGVGGFCDEHYYLACEKCVICNNDFQTNYGGEKYRGKWYCESCAEKLPKPKPKIKIS